MQNTPRMDEYFHTHHITARGNNKDKIFHNNKDYNKFIQILKKNLIKFSAECHFYCLMPNHVYLVVKSELYPIHRFMQTLSATYAKYYNDQYNHINHVFGKPFGSKPVSNDTYFIELCFYIHLNPVKAGLVAYVDDYVWSSHDVYRGKKQEIWVNTTKLMELLKERVSSPKPYYSFIYDRDNYYERPSGYLYDQDGFLMSTDDYSVEFKQREKRLNLSRFTIDEIVLQICKSMSLSKRQILSDEKIQKLIIARSLVVYYAHFHGGRAMKDIALVLHRNPAAMSRTMYKVVSKENSSNTGYWMKCVEQDFWRKLIGMNIG
jgi:putative transposase